VASVAGAVSARALMLVGYAAAGRPPMDEHDDRVADGLSSFVRAI